MIFVVAVGKTRAAGTGKRVSDAPGTATEMRACATMPATEFRTGSVPDGFALGDHQAVAQPGAR